MSCMFEQEEDGFSGVDKKRFRYDPAVSANPDSGSSDGEGENGEAGDEDFMADEFGDDDLEGKALTSLFL